MATETGTHDELDVAVEEREAWKRRLTITVGAERAGRARERERRRLAGSLRLPGFRKGHVPPEVVEKRYGPVLDQRTANALVEETYREALERTSLRPVGEPSFGQIRYEPGESLTFQVEFEILPELRLQRLGGFRVKRPAVSVGEEEVEEVIGRLREEHASWKPVERGPARGDLVSVRIAREDEGDEGEAAAEPRAYRFELGAGYAIPQVEEAILELEPDRTGTFSIRFPEDFEDPEAAGSTRTLRIELVEVKEKSLPELDDAFASEVGDFDSLGALREAVRDDLREHHEREAERAVRDRLVDAIIEANPFDVPPALVEGYLDRLIDAPEDADPARVAEARGALRAGAERQLKRQLILEAVIEREGLEPTEEVVEERIAALAEARKESPAETRRRLGREKKLDALRQQVAFDRAFEWLLDRSTVE